MTDTETSESESESGGAMLLAKGAAPYADPGLRGQGVISNEDPTPVAMDNKAAGTPPSSGSGGDTGERAASLFESSANMSERWDEMKHTETVK